MRTSMKYINMQIKNLLIKKNTPCNQLCIEPHLQPRSSSMGYNYGNPILIIRWH